jgi:hypothetical protein
VLLVREEGGLPPPPPLPDVGAPPPPSPFPFPFPCNSPESANTTAPMSAMPPKEDPMTTPARGPPVRAEEASRAPAPPGAPPPSQEGTARPLARAVRVPRPVVEGVGVGEGVRDWEKEDCRKEAVGVGVGGGEARGGVGVGSGEGVPGSAGEAEGELSLGGEGEALRERGALRVGTGEVPLVALGKEEAEAVAVAVVQAVGGAEAVGCAVVEAVGELDRVPEAVAEGEGVGEAALAEALAVLRAVEEAVALTNPEAVPVALEVILPEAEGEAEYVSVPEGLELAEGDPVRVALGVDERDPGVGEPLGVKRMLGLPCAGEGEGEPELRKTLALERAEAVGKPEEEELAEALRRSEAVAHWLGALEALALRDAELEKEGGVLGLGKGCALKDADAESVLLALA